jgi:hypothetical protein
VICITQERKVPRRESKRRARRHTTRKTSCMISSAAARSSVWAARLKITRA